MPSIAIVVNSFPKISESFIVNKAVVLAGSGYEVTIITLSKKADNFRGDLKNKIKIQLAPQASPPMIRFLLMIKAIITEPKICFRLWKQHKNKKGLMGSARMIELYAPFIRNKFDIIHFSFSGLGVIYLPIFPILREQSCLYVSCRGTAEKITPLTNVGRQEALKKLFTLVDRVHCVSRDMVNTCKKYGLNPEKAFVNPPAINSKYFKRKKINVAVYNKENFKNELFINFLSVGRLHWTRGYDTLFKSIGFVSQQKRNIRLNILGEGPERAKLTYLANLFKITDFIEFRGAVPHDYVKIFLNDADIFVHPSLSEGISNAVMEAMAMGLPVVATDVGGMKELIDSGTNGILVPPMDPQAMAQAILNLIDNLELRQQLAANARKTIEEHFDLERQKKIFLNEYNSMLAKKHLS